MPEAKIGHWVSFEDIEHLQGSDALGIGRQFKDLVAAVKRGDGLDPFGAMCSEVSLTQKAVEGALARSTFGDRGRDL